LLEGLRSGGTRRESASHTMRIAILMSVASPFSRDIAREVATTGVEIHVIDATNMSETAYVKREDHHQQSDIRDFEAIVGSVQHLPYRGGPGIFAFGWRLSRILENIGVDILLTINGGAYAAAAYLSQFRPYSVYVSGSDVLFARHAKKLIAQLALTSAKVVFANGKYLAEKARDLAPNANVVSLYMGTDTTKFRPEAKSESPISIVCSRGFLPIYNNEAIIRALALLPDGLPDYRFVFAAGGPGLADARALAGELLTASQQARIQFLGGVSREQLAQLLSRAHIYVSMSRSDGTSLSLMEGMASGVFPILSDIPANREWVDADANNVLLVPCDRPGDLAKALTGVIQDVGLRSAAALRNRCSIVDRADLKTNMTEMVRELARHLNKSTKLKDAAATSRVHAD